MDVALRQPGMSLDEFRDEFRVWEARQDGRWEFDGHGPVAMGEAWEAVVLTGSAVLDLPEIGVQVPLPEAYADIAFEDDQATPSA